MKESSLIRTLLVSLVLFLGVQFSGCNSDDENGPVPTASFTFSSTNNQNAPTLVSFTNVNEIDVNYSWIFGNGETGTGSDPEVTYTEDGTYTVQLTASSEAGTSQSTLEVIVGPFSISSEHLIGTWSIVREEITLPGSSTSIVHEYPMNWETLQYEKNGDYERVSLDWVELERGNFSVNNNILSQTPTEGNDDFSALDILITAYGGGEMEVELDMEEPGVGTIHLELVLRENGPEYFGGGDYPKPSLGDFAGSKWSVLEETRTYYEYSATTDKYTNFRSEETMADVPYNFNTFLAIPGVESSLYIDNWEYGTYERYYRLRQIRPFTIYWIDEEEDGNEVVLLINNNLDGNNIEIISAGFFEDEGEKLKFEAVTTLKRSDGSEPTITESELTANWEVTAKTETKDGIDVNPIDSYTPPIGFVLGFNADGSAVLGDPTPGSWYVLDDSNFVVVSPEGDETLVHVTGWSTPTLTAFSKWLDDGAVFQMELSLELQ